MDGKGWRRYTQIAKDELEKFSHNFTRFTNRDLALVSLNVLNRVSASWSKFRTTVGVWGNGFFLTSVASVFPSPLNTSVHDFLLQKDLALVYKINRIRW